MSRILDSIGGPEDLRELDWPQMEQLAGEVRQLIVEVVSRNRGHLASNLGVVELTLALHRCFDFSQDRLIWDCGHQCYAHKIITGRRDAFAKLRQEGGVSGFADRRESVYDAFSFGHTGTSISAALGLAAADRALGRDRHVVAVVGDGAIASGMAFEALNHAGELDVNLLVVLNDNRMTISHSVGAFSRYLRKIRARPPFSDLRRELQDVVSTIPIVGGRFDRALGHVREALQTALTPGGLFVELGFHYYGPFNGHNIQGLVDALGDLRRLDGPVMLHVLTEKGHGFEPAKQDPTRYHSSSRFEVANGTVCSEEPTGGCSYSDVFGEALCRLAEEDRRVVALTAAMPDGTGLGGFASRFPDRFYDVGICEQHAVGLAGGLAAGGLKPVFAVYSPFLQRATDQLLHDIGLQEAGAVFCIDRAGLVGADGPTHHGLYDIGYLRAVPGFVVMAPKDGAELRAMLRMALGMEGPVAIRYPREDVPDAGAEAPEPELALGQAEVLRRGEAGALIGYGATVRRAIEAADLLREEDGLEVTVVNARFAAPLDRATISSVVREHAAVLVAEDHSAAGGFGSAVLEALAQEGVPLGHVRLVGVPREPVTHASREAQLARCGLDAAGLAAHLRLLLGR